MIRLFPREETFLPQFGRADEVIVEAARVLDAMAGGPTLDDERAAEINRLENEADTVAQLAIGRLFAESKDPIEVMKWKETWAFRR